MVDETSRKAYDNGRHSRQFRVDVGRDGELQEVPLFLRVGHSVSLQDVDKGASRSLPSSSVS